MSDNLELPLEDQFRPCLVGEPLFKSELPVKVHCRRAENMIFQPEYFFVYVHADACFNVVWRVFGAVRPPISKARNNI